MAEEEVSYASVVIKSNKTPQSKAKNEEPCVYEEVRVNDETVQPSADTKYEAKTRLRYFQLLTCCLGTLCIILMSVIIGIIMYRKQFANLSAAYQNLNEQNQELQAEKKNLTEQIKTMEKTWTELNVSRAQWSIDAYCPLKMKVRTCEPCQQGWSIFNSSCYAYNDAPPSSQLRWEDAQKDCRGKISDLTVVADNKEKDFVKSISKPGEEKNEYWIGLKAVEGKWKWINGSYMTNINWISPPANDSLCVVSVLNQDWKPVRCEEKKAWICEKKALSL
ncbi:C-type lectin domain family 4 member G-like [Nematolebias whitei]|uniref:C-type lectin domain family 4 member G-like n=1 Tax=Nematolebias whitei TaxID=451745 RepID=UPI001898C691|nr:C-type lectin domain family 4 member G-like [Nematolebias whitei]